MDINEIVFPNVGDVIVVKERLERSKYRVMECTVEGVYKNYMLIRRNDIKTKETITRVSIYTGEVKIAKCS